MIFDIINSKVVVIEEAMTVPVIKALHRSDKTKGSRLFDRYMRYIFYVYRENGIYKNQFIATRRRLTCVQQLQLKETDWEEIERNRYVSAVIDWYKENSQSKEEQLLVALDQDIDEYLKYLKGIKYTKQEKEVIVVDGSEQFHYHDVDNSTEKMKAIKNSKDLIIYRTELKKLVRQTGKKIGSKKSFRTRKFEE